VLADVIQNTMVHHGITKPPVVIGYSIDAIMAAALLLTSPRLLAGLSCSSLSHRSGMIHPLVWMGCQC
jgi:pimeloyl-ACP methyl ester carboxylesterase